MALRLIIEDYEGETTVVPLSENKGPVTLGREETSTIQLTERNVSRSHARLSFDGNRWSLEDTDSYNGVRVNGVLIDDQMPLDEGDIIQIGDYRILLGSDIKQSQSETATTVAANDDTIVGTSGQLPALTRDQLKEVTDPTGRGPTDPPWKVEEVVTQRNTMVESAYDSARAAADDSDKERSGGSKAGWLVGVVVLLGVVAGYWWQQQQGAVESLQPDFAPPIAQKDIASNDDPSDKKPMRRQALPDPQPDATNVQTTELPPPSEGEAVERTGDAALVDDAPDAEMEAALADDEDIDDAESAQPASRSRNTAAMTPSKARALLKQARSEALGGNHLEAYKLAKKSFRGQQSQEALQLMGLSACKLDKRRQAIFAYARLRSAESRQMLRKVCSAAGIDLG